LLRSGSELQNAYFVGGDFVRCTKGIRTGRCAKKKSENSDDGMETGLLRNGSTHGKKGGGVIEGELNQNVEDKLRRRPKNM